MVLPSSTFCRRRHDHYHFHPMWKIALIVVVTFMLLTFNAMVDARDLTTTTTTLKATFLSKTSLTTTPTTTISSLINLRGGANSNNNNANKRKNVAPARKASSPPPPPPRQTQQKPSKAAAAAVTETTNEGASIPNEIFNLVKSIVGAGVLGLPAGIAAFGDTHIAVIPTLFLIGGIGILSAYGFSLIGRVCAYTQARSYRDAWGRAVSSKTSWIPAAACFMVTSCSVLAYSMILSDTLPSLTQSLLNIALTRTQALLGITVVALLPLCLLKSLKALAPFSLIGIIGMIYTSCAVALRYLDGTYKEGGKYYESLSAIPQFGSSSTTSLMSVITNPSIFVLVSMLSTAFMAHYNAPKFYWELENNTLERYQLVVNVSFMISMLMFMTIASFGFMTFGTACTGLVLKNYSTKDPLMSLSRVAVLLSLLFSYPLAFVGVRDGMLDLLQVKKRPNSLLNSITVGLLAFITVMAYSLNDLRTLLAFNGATWGNAVIYLLPTYMFVQCSKTIKPELKAEVPLVILTGILGLGMGIVGTMKAIGR